MIKGVNVVIYGEVLPHLIFGVLLDTSPCLTLNMLNDIIFKINNNSVA